MLFWITCRLHFLVFQKKTKKTIRHLYIFHLLIFQLYFRPKYVSFIPGDAFLSSLTSCIYFFLSFPSGCRKQHSNVFKQHQQVVHISDHRFKTSILLATTWRRQFPLSVRYAEPFSNSAESFLKETANSTRNIKRLTSFLLDSNLQRN